MAELQFDENGWPVWGSSAGPNDPEPVAAAIAAMNSIGAPGGIPYPGNLQPGPGSVPVGEPPTGTRENALINPDNGSYEYPSPDAVQLAAPQPAIGTGMPAGFAPFDPQQVISAPAESPVGPAVTAAGARTPAINTAAASQPAGRRRVDPLAAANAGVDTSQMDAAQAVLDHGVAVNDAARALAERRAATDEEYAGRQVEADTQFQAARAKAQTDADQETARWMADLEAKAKEEPNPKRWFANQSTPSKALWLLSLAFGTKAAMTAPGVQNIGLAMIREEMDKDMGEQKARMAREMEALRTKGGLIDKKAAQRMAFLKDDHNIRSGQLLSLEKAALERANAPGSADDRAAMAQAHSWLAQQRMATAAQRAQQAFQARESQLSRGHSAWMQKNAQDWQSGRDSINHAEAAAKDALDRSWKMMEAQAAERFKTGKAGAVSTLDQKATGINVVSGGKAAPLALNTGNEFGQKRYEQVTSLANAAQEVSAELRIIQDAIRDGSFTERVLGADTNLQSAVVRLGYSKAKENDPRGIVTNADFTAGVVSAMGMKYDTATGRFKADVLQRINSGDPTKAQVEAIERELAVVESRTSAKLNTFVPAEDRAGGKIVWRAENRNPAESQTESLDEMTTRVTGQTDQGWIPRGIDEPVTMKDLEAAQAAAASGAQDALPRYHQLPSGRSTGAVVDEARKAFGDKANSLSPDLTVKLSEGFQSQVSEDSRARLEIIQATEAAVNVAKEREAAVRDKLVVQTTMGGKPLTRELVVTEMARGGLKPMTAKREYVDELMKAVEALDPTSGVKK